MLTTMTSILGYLFIGVVILAVFMVYEPLLLTEVGVSCFPFGGGCMIGWLAAYLQATPGTRPVGSHRQHEYP